MPLLVVGHAGAAGEAPANTLAGVRACLAARADAMEVDVRLSADGVPVLIHDETADRTTNLLGPVRRLSFAALQEADAGNGEPVPSLTQVLALVAGRLAVFCELKVTPDDPGEDARLVEAVVASMVAAAAVPWCAVHSFAPAIVRRARELAPGLSAALVSPPVAGDALDALLDEALRCGAGVVSLEHTAVTPAAVRAARRRQLTVWAWTADLPEEWQQLRAAGVDGVVTNVPSRLRAWLAGSR